MSIAEEALDGFAVEDTNAGSRLGRAGSLDGSSLMSSRRSLNGGNIQPSAAEMKSGVSPLISSYSATGSKMRCEPRMLS